MLAPSKKHNLQFAPAPVAVGSTAFKFKVSVVVVVAVKVVESKLGTYNLDVEGLKYMDAAWLITGSLTPDFKNNSL